MHVKVRISDRMDAWSTSQGTWFHDYLGSEFEVTAVYGGREPVYEVDVSHLAAAGRVRFAEAYVPGNFAEVVSATAAVSSPSFAQ